MKHTLTILLLATSFTGFSQDTLMQAPDGNYFIKKYHPKPDTLRATLIVYFDNGRSILHTMPGFVVRQEFKDNIYLDDRKRVVKKPVEVFSYKLK
jgi:hypothetical protein